MELTPALASHLTKAQSHLTHLPGLYELYRTCFASTCETTAKLLAGGEAFVFTGDIPAMWLRDSSAQVRHYLPLAGEDTQLQALLEGSFRGRRNISVSTPMPTPLMKIRTTAAGMRTKPFSRRGLGRGSMKRILCATRFGSHGLIGKQQAAHRCSRRNGERPPTKFSTHCAQSRATVSNRLTDSSGHGQLNRAMRGKRCKTTALARP